jgi:hypothetical protein
MVALAIGQEEIVRHVATWAAPRPDRCGIDSTAPGEIRHIVPLAFGPCLPSAREQRGMYYDHRADNSQIRRAAL